MEEDVYGDIEDRNAFISTVELKNPRHILILGDRAVVKTGLLRDTLRAKMRHYQTLGKEVRVIVAPHRGINEMSRKTKWQAGFSLEFWKFESELEDGESLIAVDVSQGGISSLLQISDEDSLNRKLTSPLLPDGMDTQVILVIDTIYVGGAQNIWAELRSIADMDKVDIMIAMRRGNRIDFNCFVYHMNVSRHSKSPQLTRLFEFWQKHFPKYYNDLCIDADDERETIKGALKSSQPSVWLETSRPILPSQPLLEHIKQAYVRENKSVAVICNHISEDNLQRNVAIERDTKTYCQANGWQYFQNVFAACDTEEDIVVIICSSTWFPGIVYSMTRARLFCVIVTLKGHGKGATFEFEMDSAIKHELLNDGCEFAGETLLIKEEFECLPVSKKDSTRYKTKKFCKLSRS